MPQPQHQQHDHGFQTAAADAHQGFAAAAGSQHHAQTEHEAAQNSGQPEPTVGRIKHLGRIDLTRIDQSGKTKHGDPKRQTPLPHACPVAHVEGIADRAHGAKMRTLSDGAKGRADAKGQQQQLGIERGEVVSLHARILRAAGYFKRVSRSLAVAAASDCG